MIADGERGFGIGPTSGGGIIPRTAVSELRIAEGVEIPGTSCERNPTTVLNKNAKSLTSPFESNSGRVPHGEYIRATKRTTVLAMNNRISCRVSIEFFQGVE
jgi:hypothetical protein